MLELNRYQEFVTHSIQALQNEDVQSAQLLVHRTLNLLLEAIAVSTDEIESFLTRGVHRDISPVDLTEKQVKKSHVIRRAAQSSTLIMNKIQSYHKSMSQKIQARKAKEREREAFAKLPIFVETFLLLCKFCIHTAYREYYSDIRISSVELWENKNKLSLACDKAACNIYSFIKASNWQRAFSTAIFVNVEANASQLQDFKFTECQ